MALNKKRTITSANVSAAKVEPVPATKADAKSEPKVSDLAALQTALAEMVKLITDLSGKLEAANGRIDELSTRIDELESKLNAALEDDDDEDDGNGDDDGDGDGDDDEGDDDEGDDVTADDIDCNKAYKQLTSMDADQQKEVLVEAMKSLGVKSLQARSVRKDANVALAVAEVMCSDKFGWDVEDFLKD